MEIYRKPLLENSPASLIVVEMTQNEAATLYSETRAAVETENGRPGASPTLRPTSSIAKLRDGLKPLFPEEGEEASGPARS